jgi:hypothetical protein
MPATNQQANLAEGLESPYDNAAAITPNDSTDLSYATRAIYVGQQGTLTVTMLGGGDVTFNCGAHMLLPIRVTRVLATGTSADDLVALW